METREMMNQSITFRSSIIEKNETNMQNIENYIEDLQNTYSQEMENVYSYYVNIKEVIDNLMIEFPMIDISSIIILIKLST